MRFSILLMALFMLSGCDDQNATPNLSKDNLPTTTASKIEEPYVILALGDSLTEGLGVNKSASYPAKLQHALHELGYTQVKVVNSGLSGETSNGLKSRLEWVLQLNPDLTILNIGANDAMRGLPLEFTTDNINEIIIKIKSSGSDLILAGMQIYDNLGQEYVSGFKDMYPQLATEHELVMIPFFLDQVAGEGSLNQPDMIHPTSAGYEVIVSSNVLPVVLPFITQHLTQDKSHE